MIMKKPECLLLRVGELALKSDQVQRKWFRILLSNVKKALGAGFRLESDRNRIFVYGNTKKAAKKLEKVFGLTSFSQCWTCSSSKEAIAKLAVDVGKRKVGKKSFAIRARRAGKHDFTSQELARDVGAAVVRATGAKVNLTKPGITISIEARPDKAYIFTDKIMGAGGLPVGTGGRALAIVKDKQDAVAAWLIAKRGVEVDVLGKYGPKLKKWDAARRIVKRPVLPEYQALVIGEKTRPLVTEMLVLRPLVAWKGADISKVARKIGL